MSLGGCSTLLTVEERPSHSDRLFCQEVGRVFRPPPWPVWLVVTGSEGRGMALPLRCHRPLVTDVCCRKISIKRALSSGSQFGQWVFEIKGN